MLLDQGIKIAVKGFSLFGIQHTGMSLGESFPLIGDFARITFVQNPGMAFGITFGSGKIFLSIFSLIASVALAWYLYKSEIPSSWVKFGLALILAGAAGNLIDRMFYGVFYSEGALFYGQVVDFIDVEFWDFSLLGHLYTRFPVFNVADSCVSCGMVVLLFNHKHIPFVEQDKSSEPTIISTESPEIPPESYVNPTHTQE